MDSTKLCPGCGEMKPLSAFAKRSARPSGVQSRCRVCVSAKAKPHHRAKRDVPLTLSDLIDASPRFWKNVNRRSPSECWPWTTKHDGDGYGVMSVRYHPVRMHRMSWSLAHQRLIPQGMVVMHKCDNPICVNPSHLHLGTAGDNTRDMFAKGRESRGDRHWTRLHPEKMFRGEANHNARLTTMAVRDIRERTAQGAHRSELAREYGVTRQTIKQVVLRKSWAHVP